MKYKIMTYLAAASLATTLTGCMPEMDLNNPSEVSTETYY